MVSKFSFEDSLVACGYSNGILRVYNINNSSKLCQVNTTQGIKQQTPINCLRWRPNNNSQNNINSVILVANTNGTILQYSAKNGKQLYRGKQQNNIISSLDYNCQGNQFATAGSDNIIRLYDQQKKQLTTQLKGIRWQTNGHCNRIKGLKYNNNNSNIIISGGWDLNINVWDIRTGSSIKTIYGPKIIGDAIDIKDQVILTGSDKGYQQIQLWDIRNDKQSSSIFSAQFSHLNQDQIIACGGLSMRIFKTNGSQQCCATSQQSQTLYSCDSGYLSNRYIFGGKRGILYFINSTKVYQ